MNKQTQKSELGMVGLGVMGRNLVLNVADHGFSVVGYDKDVSKVAASGRRNAANIRGAESVWEFVGLLRRAARCHDAITHQDCGALDHVIKEKGDIVRIYLPPDAGRPLWLFGFQRSCPQNLNGQQNER